MKSIASLNEKKNIYPCLKITPEQTIVMFFAYRAGTVVYSGVKDKTDYDYPVGLYSESWVMENFKDFDGTVTLTND